jgi:small subunit ribosomal protein S9
MSEKIIAKEKKKQTQAWWDDAKKVGYAAAGKRKTAVARVWLRPGSGKVFVNRRAFVTFRPSDTAKILAPLKLTRSDGRFDVHAFINGGGVASRVDALAHGITRALLKLNPDHRAILKPEGLITRDSREKERKKYFHKRARKSTQFRKR